MRFMGVGLSGGSAAPRADAAGCILLSLPPSGTCNRPTTGLPTPPPGARLAGETPRGSALAGREPFAFLALPASPPAASPSAEPFPAHPTPSPPTHASEGPPPRSTPATGLNPPAVLGPGVHPAAPRGSPRRGLTLGVLLLAQMPSACSCRRISQAKREGCSSFSWAILATTSGVAMRGLLPPMTLGSRAPVR